MRAVMKMDPNFDPDSILPSTKVPTEPAMPPSLSGRSDIKVCPNCRTTIIAFDPPVKLEPTEACGSTKPGNWPISQFLQVCLLNKDHEGQHYGVIELEEHW